MNYIDYFKKGGKSNEADQLAEKIFTAAKALQIPAEVVDAKLNELVQAGDQNTMTTLQSAVDSFISANGQDQEAAQTIVSIFQGEPSQIFKCGGKLQHLADKFAKGGKSRCGCSGVKIAAQGMEVPPEVLNGLMFVEREYTPDGKAVYTMAKSRETLPSNMRSNPFSEYAQNGGEYQGEGQVRVVDDGKGYIRIDADPYGPMGNIIEDEFERKQYMAKLLELLKNAGINPGPALRKQGGIIKAQNGISMKGTIAAVRPLVGKMPYESDPRLKQETIVTPDLNNPLARFTDEQLAKAVIAGKYGSGAARRKALGDRYAAVQSIINQMMAKPKAQAQNTPAPASQAGYNQIILNVPGGFVPENTPEKGNFSINSTRPASEYGARSLIERNERAAQRGPVRQVVYPYTTGTVVRPINSNTPVSKPAVQQKPTQVVYPYTTGTVVRRFNAPANERKQVIYPYTTGEVVRPYKQGGELTKSLKCGGKPKKKK